MQIEDGRNGPVIHNTRRRQAIRRGQKPAGGWLHSPAMLYLFAAALLLLEVLAKKRNTNLGVESRVTKVRAARVPGKPEVFIYPVDWDDPLGIEIKVTKGKKYVNLYDFMAEASQLVDLHHAERFDFVEAGPESPVGAAFKFNPEEWAERKYVKPSVKKSKGQGQGNQKNKGTTPPPGPQAQPGLQPQAAAQPQPGLQPQVAAHPQPGTQPTSPENPSPAAAAQQTPSTGATTK